MLFALCSFCAFGLLGVVFSISLRPPSLAPAALLKGEVDLRVGNGARVAAVSVGTFVLTLPSDLELCLNNCYYVPQLTKNIISVSVLDTEGFCIFIKNQMLTFSLDDLVHGQATSVGEIYIS